MFYTKRTKIVLNAAMIILVCVAFFLFILNLCILDFAWGKWITGTVCLLGISIASVAVFSQFIRGKGAILPCSVIGVLSVPFCQLFCDSLNWPYYLNIVCSIALVLLVLGTLIGLSYRYYRQEENCPDEAL